MKKYLVAVACLTIAAGAVYAANKEQKRLENCGVVMQEVINVPDNIPKELLEKAECVTRTKNKNVSKIAALSCKK